MTDNNHPIIPPTELIQTWLTAPRFTNPPRDVTFVVQKCHSLSNSEIVALATEAARWGADQELGACCEWLEGEIGAIDPNDLRVARRPKAPSLKEQALEALELNNDYDSQLSAVHYNIIRRALESLPS